MTRGNYTINDIYQGNDTSFEPKYGSALAGYKISAGDLGLTTDPRTANILQEVSGKLSTGAKHIEVAAVSPQVFEAIPEQHLEEINRLSKLTGVDVTLHAPVVEPSGLTKEGFSESEREGVERQMTMAIERSHKINPDGSSPVTFHSSAGLPGQLPQKGKKETSEVYVVDTDSGQIAGRIPIKERFFPGEKGEISIKKELQKINEDQWSQQLSNLGYSTERANEFINSSGTVKLLSDAEKKEGKDLTPMEKQAIQTFRIGKQHLKDSYRQLKRIYETAYKKAIDNNNENEIKVLKEFEKNVEKQVNEMKKGDSEIKDIEIMRNIIDRGLETLDKVSTPETYTELNTFSKDKTTETFANVALNSFKKFKDKAPIISIENPPIGGAFSTGEELKQIVEESRKKFVDKAVNEGVSKSEAQKQANKLIGATWDVGHINMMRKHGYTEEDIIKETEKVAPLVKHVHLSDNFGFEHTELPMGMGNVPLKEMMEKLGEKGFEAKKVIEAAQWFEHFKTPPFQQSLEALGSPIYSREMSPGWNESQGFHQGYFSGYGATLPPIHYETFGAGFAQLPIELGGQRGGASGSRMSGTPME